MTKEITKLEEQISNLNDRELAQYIINVTKMQAVGKQALEYAKKCGRKGTILHSQEKL